MNSKSTACSRAKRLIPEERCITLTTSLSFARLLMVSRITAKMMTTPRTMSCSFDCTPSTFSAVSRKPMTSTPSTVFPTLPEPPAIDVPPTATHTMASSS